MIAFDLRSVAVYCHLQIEHGLHVEHRHDGISACFCTVNREFECPGNGSTYEVRIEAAIVVSGKNGIKTLQIKVISALLRL